jgi:hypothetical protein
VTHSPLVEAAADYLNRGLAVIALAGKTPNGQVHRHGLHEPIVGDVLTAEDYQLLAGAFNHPATTGIGILTRWPYVVLDIDGEEGAQQWSEIVGEMNVAPDTWVAKTGRGVHLWFATHIRTGTIKLGPKLDLKGEGGYVAAPPSLHPDGHRYEWLIEPSTAYVAEAPDALMELIEDHVFDIEGKKAAKVIRTNAWGPKYKPGDHVFYAQANHDRLIEGMTTAEEGNRNAYLHWAASTLAEEAGSDEEYEQLAEAALAVGLTREEVRRTVKSARRAHGV